MAVKPFLKPYSLSRGNKFHLNTTSSTGVEICNPSFGCQGRDVHSNAFMPIKGRVGLSTGVSLGWIHTTCVNSAHTNPAQPSSTFFCSCAKQGFLVVCNSGPTVCSRSLSAVQSRESGTWSKVSLPNKKKSVSVLQAKKKNQVLGSQPVQRDALHIPKESQRSAHQQQPLAQQQPQGQEGGIAHLQPLPSHPIPQKQKKGKVVFHGKQLDHFQSVHSPQPAWPRKNPLFPGHKILPGGRRDGSHTLKQPTVPTKGNRFGVDNRPKQSPVFNLSSNPRVSLKGFQEKGFNKTQTQLPNYFDKAKTGVIYLYCTLNNTVCTLVDSKGFTKGWTSCGSMGFKSARKSTAYASQATAEKIGLKAKELGLKWVFLVLKGIGRGKESGVRALRKSGVEILGILEKTGIPHNGCRLPKKRRV